MLIDIITVLPEMIEGFLNCSILKRAQDKGLAEICLHYLRDFTHDKHRRVDDYPYGGIAGMVMKIEPIENCINFLKSQREYDDIIFTTPDGEQFSQPMANELSLKKNLIILCGHFKGIDYRIREHLITREISIGDYVLTGGELAAAVMTDAIVRLLLADLERRIHERGLELSVSNEAVDRIVERGYDPAYGARPLKRQIQTDLENPIARLILRGEFHEGDTLFVDTDGASGFRFETQSPPAKADA